MGKIAAAALAVCLAVAGDLRAQPAPATLYLAYTDESGCTSETYPACRVSRLLRATLDGPRTRVDWQRVVPTADLFTQGYVTPDGRFVTWLAISLATGPNVYLHDTVTGQTTAIGPFIEPQMLLGNPARPEVYVFDRSGVITLSPTGMRRRDLPCQPNPFNTLPGITTDGRIASVVLSCAGGVTTVVFDTVSGASLAAIDLFGVVSADGTELFTSGGFDSTRNQAVFQRRTLSGTLLSEAPAVGQHLIQDPVSGGIVTWDRNTSSNNIALLDRATLATTWAGRLSISGTANYSAPVFDPASGLAAAFWDGVDVVDVRAGVSLGRAPLRASPTASIMFGPPAPAAPTVQQPVVTGNAVQLAWAPGGSPAAVSHFLLDVGSAPGLSNIFNGLDVGAQASFGASGVPPGTYFVRVRAENHAGISTPSNEVLVQVP